MTTQVGRIERLGSARWWLARSIVFTVSVVALVSFGGQVFLAPFLVPLQWVVAGRSERPGRLLFTLLAALLVGEVGWMAGYLASGAIAAAVAGLVTGVATAVLFYRSARARS